MTHPWFSVLHGGGADAETRVELVRAGLHHPALMLMDEATVGLDTKSRHDLLAHLLGHARRDRPCDQVGDLGGSFCDGDLDAMGWDGDAPSVLKAPAEPVPFEKGEPLALECRHFLDCASAGATPRSDAAESLRVLSVLDACQRALQTGAPVNLKPAP